MIGFSLGFVDDLWSNLCYVDLLLMLDDLDACNVREREKKKKNTLRVYRRGLANDRRGLGWSLVLFLFFSFLSFFFFFFFFG